MLQYSCLENPVDRGAWWAAVHGVAQSQTRLKRLSMCASCWRSGRVHGLHPRTLHFVHCAAVPGSSYPPAPRLHGGQAQNRVADSPCPVLHHPPPHLASPGTCCVSIFVSWSLSPAPWRCLLSSSHRFSVPEMCWALSRLHTILLFHIMCLSISVCLFQSDPGNDWLRPHLPQL